MNPLALVGFVGLFLIVLGVLWVVFSSKKEQAHIVKEVGEKTQNLADAGNAVRADIAADIAKVQAEKAEPNPAPER